MREIGHDLLDMRVFRWPVKVSCGPWAGLLALPRHRLKQGAPAGRVDSASDGLVN
ncbi:hypothetical protein JF542_21405 [Salipiger bermudensis]|nr:hypothetical protein [Salipiger bermudensis]